MTVVLVSCAEERPRAEPEFTGRVHPPGNLDETSDRFHGRELARRDYDFGLCAKCHGDDFAGGNSGVSCLDCHEEGPTACTTCHREDVERGAHAVHRIGGESCGECHIVPSRWDDDGHVRRGGTVDPAPAEVVFGARAMLTPVPADRAGAPSFADGTCTNIYCHGATLAAGGTNTSPRWTDPVTTGCDRCHASPPPDHARDDCAACHPASAPHVDGTLQVGVTPGCDGCHGNPAPPSGAHAAHLAGASLLRAPLACAECHVVPATVTAPGHIDSPLPAEVIPSAGYDPQSGTCTTWCHGTSEPDWTEQGVATCGSCHAVPPATPAHAGVVHVQMCASCHPAAAHMNGAVDVL